ncbi:MAG: DsbA family protein [Candidatus Aenigmatarchaeota archaeon]
MSKSTIVLLVLALGIGYLLGNVFGVSSFTGQTVETTQTQPQPTQQQQPPKVQVSVDDDPGKGDKNANVIVIEFSDFQCPFCRRFYTQTLPQLEEEYIKTGKVYFVYRDFPLDSIHPGATPAAQAAECADEQGKFWEMHNKIFDEQNKQGQGTVQFSNDDLKKWASELGLNIQKFNQCLDSGKYAQEVQKDFQDGVAVGVSGTPTFFIGNSKDGYTSIVGAQPYSVFKQVIDSYLTEIR